MKPILTALLLFISLPLLLRAQHFQVQGTVRDAGTNAPLPFVSILINQGPAGTTTDIAGKFRVSSKEPVQMLTVSYLGYETQQFNIPANAAAPLTLQLKPSATSLREVLVRANRGPNPAHRIIKLATQHRKQNDPGQLESYTCRVYTKTVITMQPKVVNGDTISEKVSTPSTSGPGSMGSFLRDNYLFLAESVSERSFMKPDLNKETVLATRVSGLQKPRFAALATNNQEFSVYTELVNFFGKTYLSPLSEGSTRKYDFRLEATTYAGTDTTFIISYQPQPEKNFDGLKGQLHITSDGWAVVNILAEASEKDKQDIRLQQHYEKVGTQRWFPVQVNTDFIIKSPFNPDLISIANIRSNYTNINLQPELKRREFKAVTITMNDDAHSQPADFWQQYRPNTLSTKERNTYHNLDSLGKANNFDAKFRFLEAIFSKQLPIGPVSLDLDKLLKTNRYEALRLGLGAHTNELVSRHFSLGGFAGYGFRDQAFKYGGDLRFNLYPASDLRLTLAYSEDVQESGGTVLPFYDPPLITNNLRDNLIRNMDKVTHQSAFFSLRTLKYLDLKVGLQQEIKRPTNGYVYQSGPDSFSTNFHFTEAEVGMRYAFREQRMQMFNRTISMGTNYPVVYFRYRKGLNNLLNGQFEYHKFDFRAEKTLRQKALGATTLVLTSGLVQGNAPYANLYNGHGAFLPKYRLYSGEGFETMGLTEFLSDRYAALYLKHDFANLLYKGKGFSPALGVVTNLGIGSLTNPERHRNITFKTLERGYIESGLLITKILNSKYLAIGAGAFYRYGPNRNPEVKDNLAVKVLFDFDF